MYIQLQILSTNTAASCCRGRDRTLMPYCCICFVQFAFDVSLLICFFCLYKSDIHMSVHRRIIPNYSQQDATLLDLFLINLWEPCVLYIWRAYRYPPEVAFYILFSTNISTEYFKYAVHSPFFFSKCRLFHNATFFGSCIIQILHTGCAKI